MFRLVQKENLIIPAHIDYLASLRDFITQIGKKYHFSHKFINTFKLAVDEAATNIIKHAYSETEGYITVQAVVKSNSLTLKILDQGAYFDPKWAQELDLKESVNTDEKMGLGIFMMRKLMDEVDYKKSAAGNELTLTKKDKFKKDKLRLFNLADLPTALKIRYLIHALIFVTVLNGAGYYYYHTRASAEVKVDFIEAGKKISKQVTQQLCAITPGILNGPDGLSYLKAIILPIYDENIGRIYSLSLEDSLGFIAWSTIPTELNSSFKRPELSAKYEKNIFNYSIGRENAVYEFESELIFETGKAFYKKLHVLISSNYLMHEIKKKQITYLKYVLISLGLCFILIAFISYFVSHPIHKLTKWVRAAKTGDLLDEMDIDATTEIGEIAQAFSDITEKFNQSQKHLADREKYEKEINLAKDIQHALLPKEIPEIETLEISAYYESAKTVGGDFYDFIEVDQEHIGIAIADVSGKGVPGSLMMTIIRTALRTEARGSNDAAEVLIRVNDFVVNDMKSGMFATIFYIIINTKTLVANFASAGHNPLILHSRSKKCSFNLNPSGFPVGIKLPIKNYFAQNIKSETIQLAQDELVLLYTDGITEAMNPAKQLYGEERLINIITKSSNLTVKKFTEKLKNSIYSFTEDGALHDDITFIALKPKRKTTNDIEYDPSLSVNVNFISIDDSNKIIDIVFSDPNLGAEGISHKLNTQKYGKLELEPEQVLSELSRRQLHTVALRLKHVESKKKTRFSAGKPGIANIVPILEEPPKKNKKPGEESISVNPTSEDSGAILKNFIDVLQPDPPSTVEIPQEEVIPTVASEPTEITTPREVSRDAAITEPEQIKEKSESAESFAVPEKQDDSKEAAPEEPLPADETPKDIKAAEETPSRVDTEPETNAESEAVDEATQVADEQATDKTHDAPEIIEAAKETSNTFEVTKSESTDLPEEIEEETRIDAPDLAEDSPSTEIPETTETTATKESYEAEETPKAGDVSEPVEAAKPEIADSPKTIAAPKNTEISGASKELPPGEIDDIAEPTDAQEPGEPTKIENKDIIEFDISESSDISDLLVDSIFDKFLNEALGEHPFQPSSEEDVVTSDAEKREAPSAEINEPEPAVADAAEPKSADSDIEKTSEEEAAPDDEAAQEASKQPEVGAGAFEIAAAEEKEETPVAENAADVEAPEEKQPEPAKLKPDPELPENKVEPTTPEPDKKTKTTEVSQKIEDTKSASKQKKAKRGRKKKTKTTQIELTPFVAPSEKNQDPLEYEFVLGNAPEFIGFEINEEREFEDFYDLSSDLDVEFKRELELEEYELVLDIRPDDDDDFEEEIAADEIEASSGETAEEPLEVKSENVEILTEFEDEATTLLPEEPNIEEIVETESVESVTPEKVETATLTLEVDDLAAVETDEIKTETLQTEEFNTEEIAENEFVNAVLDNAINFNEIDEIISDDAASVSTEQTESVTENEAGEVAQASCLQSDQAESVTESEAQSDGTALPASTEAKASDAQPGEDIPSQTGNTEDFSLELFADLDVYDDGTFARDLAEFDQPTQEKEKPPEEPEVREPRPFSELQANEFEDVYRTRPYKSRPQETETSATEAAEQEPKTEALRIKTQIIEEPISEPVEISSAQPAATEPEAQPPDRKESGESNEGQEIDVQYLDGLSGSHTEEPQIEVSSEAATAPDVEEDLILRGNVLEETIFSENESAELLIDDEDVPVSTEEISFQQPAKQFPDTPFNSLKTNETEDKYAKDLELKQSKAIKRGIANSQSSRQEAPIEATETTETEVTTSHDNLTQETQPEITRTAAIQPIAEQPTAEPVAEATEPEITTPESEQTIPSKGQETSDEKNELKEHLMTGVKHYKNKEYEDAIIFLKKVIKLDPDEKEAFAMLGNAYYRNGMLYEAIIAYEQLQPHNLKDPSIYENLGLIYWKLNQKKKAVSAWQSLLSLTPERADIKKRIDYLEQNGTQELKTQIRKISLKQNGEAKNSASDNGKQTILKKAIEQYRSQDYKSAIDSLKLALEHFPENTEVYTYLANAYFRNKMFDDAVKIYERLKQLDENNTNVLENLGMLHLKQGAFKQAVAEWQKIVNKQPGRADLKQKIAKVSELIEDN